MPLIVLGLPLTPSERARRYYHTHRREILAKRKRAYRKARRRVIEIANASRRRSRLADKWLAQRCA